MKRVFTYRLQKKWTVFWNENDDIVHWIQFATSSGDYCGNQNCLISLCNYYYLCVLVLNQDYVLLDLSIWTKLMYRYTHAVSHIAIRMHKQEKFLGYSKENMQLCSLVWDILCSRHMYYPDNIAMICRHLIHEQNICYHLNDMQRN